MRLENKIALVTGGGQGIGKEIAKTLAKQGAFVLINYLDLGNNQEIAQKTQQEIEELGGKCALISANVASYQETEEMFKIIKKEYGRLDILINNAGVLDKGLNAIDQIDYDDLNRVIDINQKGTMYCMSEALKVMKSGASIVNISSVAGQYGAGGAVYVSTKAAIIGVTKHAAMRFAKEKIRCNVICPGSITTDMAAGLTPDTMDMKMMGAMSAHSDLTLQPCSPLDVAKVALFLASDDAAPLTGQVVVSDYGVDL